MLKRIDEDTGMLVCDRCGKNVAGGSISPCYPFSKKCENRVEPIIYFNERDREPWLSSRNKGIHFCPKCWETICPVIDNCLRQLNNVLKPLDGSDLKSYGE